MNKIKHNDFCNLQPIRLLLIDNYDSFTFNLCHLILSQKFVELDVVRNDEAGIIDKIDRGIYDGVVIGPGPGSPVDEEYFGINKKIIMEYGTKSLPVLGVCLGFQGIFHCFGGSLKVAELPVHGKLSELDIIGDSVLLHEIPCGCKVMRYHSILCDVETTSNDLKITAYAAESEFSEKNGKEAMALEHKKHPIFGLQFHPESFATEFGNIFIRNFLTFIREKSEL